jgi:hypothetical protein
MSNILSKFKLDSDKIDPELVSNPNGSNADYHICPVCKDCSINLVSFNGCGHLTCFSCFSTLMENVGDDEIALCPCCRGPITDPKTFTFWRYLEKHAFEGVVYQCPMAKDFGCGFKPGHILDLKQHMESESECKHLAVKCASPSCKVKAMRKKDFITRHMRACPYGVITCSLCKYRYIRKESSKHLCFF